MKAEKRTICLSHSEAGTACVDLAIGLIAIRPRIACQAINHTCRQELASTRQNTVAATLACPTVNNVNGVHCIISGVARLHDANDICVGLTSRTDHAPEAMRLLLGLQSRRTVGLTALSKQVVVAIVSLPLLSRT